MCGNKWSNYLSFSNTHSCSFWNGSVWFELAESAPGRVVLLQLLSMYDGAVGVTNLGVTLLCGRHLPAVSGLQMGCRDCARGLSVAIGVRWKFPRSYEPAIHCNTRQYYSIFKSDNNKIRDHVSYRIPVLRNNEGNKHKKHSIERRNSSLRE